VLVPAVGVRVFAGVRGAFEGFVAGDVGLRGAVAGIELVDSSWESGVVSERKGRESCSEVRRCAVGSSHSAGS